MTSKALKSLIFHTLHSPFLLCLLVGIRPQPDPALRHPATVRAEVPQDVPDHSL